MRKQTQLKDRLEVGDQLFFFDRKTIIEKTSVISVDKKAKTAMLENRVIITRYPDSKGYFQSIGRKTDHLITRLDEDNEKLYEAHIAKRKLEHHMYTLDTLLKRNPNVLLSSQSDIDLIVKAQKALNKIFNKVNNQ